MIYYQDQTKAKQNSKALKISTKSNFPTHPTIMPIKRSLKCINLMMIISVKKTCNNIVICK